VTGLHIDFYMARKMWAKDAIGLPDDALKSISLVGLSPFFRDGNP